ncbi:hypothetical protein GCM10009798_04880 [Nocardioides panacihumi]|uniref:Uncharacterized protein n=1 Tax=Nocardioides panacihumi TaxID=400774 RepID=A0ABP5BNT2_9ACTN
MKIKTRAGAAFLALVLAAVVAPLTAAGAPAAETPSRTRLVIRVDGCSSCTLNLARAFSGTNIYWRSRGKKVGSDGKVVFYVPTKRTRGLSFELAVPWQDFTDAVLNVVTRDVGQAAGESWSAGQAKAATHAFGCWAGTNRETARLHFHVAEFAFNDGKSTGAVAWASPGLKSLKPEVRTWHGSLGNQEIFYCS